MQLGDSQTTVYTYTPPQTRSDRRDKKEIEKCKLGLEFINNLTPVEYKLKIRNGYEGNRTHTGLIAQDLEKVLDKYNIDYSMLQDHKKNGGDDVKTIGYTELIAPLIVAIQELSNRVEELENKQ